MPDEVLYAKSVEAAAQEITPYLEDTSSSAYMVIYFDGWYGLAASAVLRAIAKNPEPSLKKKFDRIIHVDCSRWRSRRALQRTIADELELPQHVMDLFDRQDEEDDFSGLDESSRAEITDIRRVIYSTFMNLNCLLILNNGTDDIIDIASFGFPQNDWYNLRDNRMLWTYRGRLRLNQKIPEKVDSSHLGLYSPYYSSSQIWKVLLETEATEITLYSRELCLDGTTAKDCCLYLLSLNYQGGDIIDYNWVTHAHNYWVCDGIIVREEGRNENQAWEAAAAFHQEIRLDDYSSNAHPSFGDELDTPLKRWVLVKQEHKDKAAPKSTSIFVAFQSMVVLPNDMFHQAARLRVLRLCNCAFSFSSPPFHCCHNLRFLGLDRCQDRPQEAGEDKRSTKPALEIFQRLWVLDICYTGWELAFPMESTKEQQIAMNIREVHINKGRIWRSYHAWRKLQNLHKLRVVEPIQPWGMTGEMDEFAGMSKLELIELSKDNMIRILPSLSGAGNLKTLILDGCDGLEHVGPLRLPPSLESFSFGSRVGDKAKISSISLAGCSRLVSFTLRGPLPNLKDLNTSGTIIKMLDLRDQQDSCIEQIILLGCKKLHAILWPEQGLPKLSVLRIDSMACHVEIEQQQAYAYLMDVRFIQSLMLRSNDRFCWNYCDKIHLTICNSSAPKGTALRKEMDPYSTVIGSSSYGDVKLDMIAIERPHDASSAAPLQPLDLHVEIGEGISHSNVANEQVLSAVAILMNKVESLHLHDNSCINNVNPKHMLLTGDKEVRWLRLKWCRVDRCRKLGTVFVTDYAYYCFRSLEAFSAAELMMATCIWSRGRMNTAEDIISFAKLRSIHLHSCPRITFVLPLSWAAPNSHLPNLETLHIVCCGKLRQIFPVEPDALCCISDKHPRGVLEFSKLKLIHLHDVPKLQQICDTNRMFAPELETIRLRGCWGLKRIPATVDRCGNPNSHPVVNCEKDWWEKMEWDGLEAGHHPSLFEPRHPMYYKKAMSRASVLW